MSHVHAYTSPSSDYPSFINISRNHEGRYIVTVRTAGNAGCDVASIDLSAEQLDHLATDALDALHGHAPDERPKVTVNDSAIGVAPENKQPTHQFGDAPRVTLDDIEANIASEHFFTAKQGAEHPESLYRPGSLQALGPSLALLTFCVLVLRNGYTVTGQSACASPENFDAALGRKYAREDAVRQVWPLMGYALRERLAGGAV